MSALIVVVTLPPAVEAFRATHVPTAADGVPAHVTLLYPFVELEDVDDAARAAVRSVVGAHPRFEFRLTGVARWPTSAYLEVAPVAPFEQLVRDLVVAFPAFPPYAGAYPYVPHVSLAEDDAAVSLDPIAGQLEALATVTQRADEVVLIGRMGAGWTVAESFPLGGS